MAQPIPTWGYDCNFVEDPPDALKCLICLLVVRDPQQHGECGKLFCKSCITTYRQLKNDCPQCRQSLDTSIFNDQRSTQEVKSLRVKCENACPWIGELCNLEDHFTKCDNVIVQCTNKCQSGTRVRRRNLQAHLANKCPRRQYPCPHCKEKGEYQERILNHIKTCPNIKVQCPNVQCPDSILRCEVTTHRSICDYEKVSCKYAEVGCEEKPLRKDLKKHEEDNQLHLRIATKAVLQLKKETTDLKMETTDLKKETTDLKKEINFLEKKTSKRSFNFKMTGYQEKKKSDDFYFSPSFHTHPNGYKMCIGVYASGFGAVKGTHVSVFAYLMKGDNDDSLTWPVTGTVTVELLNQLEDKNHYEMTIPFIADSEASQRVVDGERGRGWGLPRFIRHAELDKNCQYLKKDTLIFSISVQVPDYKPWLECTS